MPSDATTLSLATAPAATLSGHPLPVVVTTPPALAPPPPGTFPYTRGLYPEMYRDWGDETEFSLKLGRGECAA